MQHKRPFSSGFPIHSLCPSDPPPCSWHFLWPISLLLLSTISSFIANIRSQLGDKSTDIENHHKSRKTSSYVQHLLQKLPKANNARSENIDCVVNPVVRIDNSQSISCFEVDSKLLSLLSVQLFSSRRPF